MRVIDKAGVWVSNTGEFRVPDYGRDGDIVFIEPGEPTKVILSDFLKSQPTIEEIEDPMSDADIKPKNKPAAPAK